MSGLIVMAKLAEESLETEEILTICWEQSQHKYPERRLLAVECCSVLASYTSASIRNSLMLSMLQQMLLEDKDPVVRTSVVKSLALLIALMDDPDKYFQVNILFYIFFYLFIVSFIIFINLFIYSIYLKKHLENFQEIFKSFLSHTTSLILFFRKLFLQNFKINTLLYFVLLICCYIKIAVRGIGVDSTPRHVVIGRRDSIVGIITSFGTVGIIPEEIASKSATTHNLKS